MSMRKAARTINATAFSYILSWALLTAAELRVSDHLPARSQDLSAISPDPDLVDTWMLTLADGGGLSYMHSGMYGMYAMQESVRQMRGTAPAQVDGAEISVSLGVGGMFGAAGCVVFSNIDA